MRRGGPPAAGSVVDDASSGALDDAGPAISDPGEGVGTHATHEGTVSDEARYAREGLLGVGGMGRVYSARDARLARQVALKVAATPALAARLAAEARITAQLEHPGIVAVYDAGESDGQAWYTMRLIRGRTLRERIAEAPDLAARLTLVPHLHAAAQAVAYAHAMGVVHRDLKPSNIMVGEFGETQVADWGLARPSEAARADWRRIVPDVDGEVSGTPRYMSPEQARGDAADATTDVYALGVALQELLTGRPRADGDEAARLPAGAPRELAAIAARCLEAAPSGRYPSAVELADDLGRWLTGRRVTAYVYPPVELLGRLVRAWRAPLAVAGVAVGVLALVVAGSLTRMAEERAAAESNLSLALTQQARTALSEHRLPEAYALAAHALRLGDSPAARGIVAAAGEATATRVAALPLPSQCRHSGRVSRDGAAIACHGEGKVEVWGLAPLALRATHALHAVEAPVWSGDALLVATPDALVRVHGDRIEPVAPESAWPLAGEAAAYAVRGQEAWALGADGAVAFRACAATRATTVVRGDELVIGCDDGWLRAYGPDGVPRWSVSVGQRPGWSSVVGTADGLLIGGLDGTVRALRLPAGEWGEPLQADAGAVRDVVVVPGADLAVVLGERGGPRVWSRRANAWVGGLPSGATRLATTSAGEVLLVGETLERWRLPPGGRPHVLSFEAGISQLAVAPAGDAVVVALGTGAVVERSLADGHERGRWQWGEQVAKCVAYGADGLLAGAIGAPARLLLAGGATRALEPGTVLRRAGRLAGGRVWATGYAETAYFVGPGGQVSTEPLDAVVVDGSSSPDARALAFLDTRGAIRVRRDDGWHEARRAPDATAVDVTDGGGSVAYARRREVCVDDVCADVGEDVVDLALSQTHLAAGTVGGGVHVLDARTLATLAVLPGHSGRVSSVEFGPDGDWLASASWDGTVRIWELGSLSVSAEALVERARDTWGLGLEDVLREP